MFIGKPKYKLNTSCCKLRWDNVSGYWWCCQTSMCYKHYFDCALVEATAFEVRKGNVLLCRIKPDSIRNGVVKLLNDRNFNIQLTLNF